MNAKDYIRMKAQSSGSGRGIAVRLEGIEDLEATLERLPQRLRNRAMRRGITKAARVLVREMKSRVPTDSRALKKAITYAIKTPKKFGKATGYPYAQIGPNANWATVTRRRDRWASVQRRVRPALYEHLVNAGAKPHQITTRNGKPLKKDILHPGAKASGYRKASVDAVKNRIMSILAEEVRNEINREIARKGIHTGRG